MTKTEFSGTIRSGYLTSDSGQARAQSCLVHYTSIYHQQGYLHARPMLPKEVQAEEPNIGYNPQMVGNDAMQLFLERKKLGRKNNARGRPSPLRG